MGRDSKIEWCDNTFNPWMGCTKVSAGCQHCYAETLMDDRWGKVQWGPQGERVRTSASNWKQPLKWNREAEADGVRQRVFCASLADVFEDRPELEPWRLDLLKMIELTPNLDWLLLTKRPENVMPMIELAQAQNNLEEATLASVRNQPGAGRNAAVWLLRHPHVGIGTSIEDQKSADERIPRLNSMPAAVKFLSMEPLLGPVDLAQAGALWTSVVDNSIVRTRPAMRLFQWVIVGGESGPKARPMHPDWVRSIRDQCVTAGVPFFFKQWGEWWPHDQGQWVTDAERHVGHDVPDDDYYKIGKHNAGRMLDGREWNEYPDNPDEMIQAPERQV